MPRIFSPRALVLPCLALLLALPATLLLAEGAPAPPLEDIQQVSLELIMSDPDWLGNAPEQPYWADDGRSVYYQRKRQGEERRDLWRLDLDGGEPLRIRDEERGGIDVDGGDWSDDRRSKAISHQGDLFVKDVVTGALRQLSRTADREHSAFWLRDGRRIAFERGDQFFVRDLDSGLESQPVVIRWSDEPDDDEPEGFLEEQQLRLFDVIREERDQRLAQRDRMRAHQEADPTVAPRPFYLGDGLEVRHQVLSPSGDWVALVVIADSQDEGRNDMMPDFVTASGYVEPREVRPKVGTGDGTTERLILLDLTTHEQHEVDLSALDGISDDPLAELRAQATERSRDEGDGENGDGDDGEDGAGSGSTPAAGDDPKPRSVRFEEPPIFSPDGSRLLLRIHSYDNKDRWIALVSRQDLETLETVHRLQDEDGWINWYFNEAIWLSDSRRFVFLSEESGYSQLYLHDLDRAATTRLTDSDSVVSDPQPTPDDRWVYFTANTEHPGHYEVYRVPTAGGATERLTHLGGRNTFRLAPDGGQLLVTHSSTTRPAELFVQAAQPGATARPLTHTVSDAFVSLPWTAPEVVAVPSSHHDRPIYSRFYPAVEGSSPDAGRKAVVFIHGAGYLQNAHKGWSVYFREFMFHTLLTQRGYAVLDMDYRASAGYGRDWRTAIYRQMGTPELEDLIDGVSWLVEEHGVDPERVGVYGGSYGGFLTMMALFKEPDLFAAGAALRPVTDWAHYNHPYTANILNTPDVDPVAYERSSPIELAAGLTKPLLICAPMQDDNVFFQDTVRLAQRLIELEIDSFEVAIYPVEPHGFRRPSSWLDEYRRILGLFESHLGDGENGSSDGDG